jgi:hypothetical protein
MTATEDDRPTALTVGEAAGLGGVAAVALLGVVSLALAQSGRHDGPLAIGITAVLLGLLVMAALRSAARPTLRVDAVELGLLAGVVAVTGFFFLPGSTYAYVDKDPGVYAAHAFAIARSGDVDVPDPVLEAGLDPPGYSGGRFPGLWLPEASSDAVTSQFYHLHSALLATGHDLGGRHAVFQATPLLAMASVALVLLAARRAAGTVPAVVAAAILATCMLQVWQAKSPGSEILAQLLFVGSGLGAVLAIQLRWWLPAAVSGALLPVGFLVRPDGFLYLVLGAALVGGVIASGRVDRRAGAFVAGLLALLPYALWNAYAERSNYTASNSVPRLPALLGGVVGCLLAGLVVHALRRRAGPMTIPAAAQRWLGLAGSVAAAAVLLLLWSRQSLLGDDFATHPGTGDRFATRDEDALHWLSWFVTVPGLITMVVGVAVLLLRPWHAARFALIVPGALLLPLYLWDPRIANRMMWWGRRFIPAALPAIALLIGLAVGWAVLQRRSRILPAVAIATAGYVVAFGASQSLDLRSHREMEGSWTMGAAVAGNGTADGSLFLFTRPKTTDVIQPNRNLPGALSLIHDRATSILTNPPSLEEIEGYHQAMPDREVLLVVGGDELPAELPRDRFQLRDTIEQPITFWEESHLERPDEAVGLRYTLTVWALRPV